MAKINKDSLAYLGADFQLRLVAQLLVDNKFAESIVEIINPNYFDDQGLKLIVSTIKEAYTEHEIIPDMGSLEFRLLDGINNDYDKKYIQFIGKNYFIPNENRNLAGQAA